MFPWTDNPVYTALQKETFTCFSATIYIDNRNVAQHDLLYSFIYTDTESETLDYNYTITPDQPAGDNAIFAWDTRGNYFGRYFNFTRIRNKQRAKTLSIFLSR